MGVHHARRAFRVCLSRDRWRKIRAAKHPGFVLTPFGSCRCSGGARLAPVLARFARVDPSNRRTVGTSNRQRGSGMAVRFGMCGIIDVLKDVLPRAAAQLGAPW